MNNLPDCYEADRQEEARDLAYTARIMRRPCCECCGERLLGERYLDLSHFGLNGYACESCVDSHTHDIEDLEGD